VGGGGLAYITGYSQAILAYSRVISTAHSHRKHGGT